MCDPVYNYTYNFNNILEFSVGKYESKIIKLLLFLHDFHRYFAQTAESWLESVLSL